MNCAVPRYGGGLPSIKSRNEEAPLSKAYPALRTLGQIPQIACSAREQELRGASSQANLEESIEGETAILIKQQFSLFDA